MKQRSTQKATALTAAQQDRIDRTVTPICRKCGRDLTPAMIGSTSREGKLTCNDCLGTAVSVADGLVLAPSASPVQAAKELQAALDRNSQPASADSRAAAADDRAAFKAKRNRPGDSAKAAEKAVAAEQKAKREPKPDPAGELGTKEELAVRLEQALAGELQLEVRPAHDDVDRQILALLNASKPKAEVIKEVPGCTAYLVRRCIERAVYGRLRRSSDLVAKTRD